MSYVEKSLGTNEKLIAKAKLNGIKLFWKWVYGITCCFLLLIPLIQAISYTIKFNHTELAVTDKRIIGKTGVFNTAALDSPLDKVQNVGVKQTFWGKVFNYADIIVTTAAMNTVFSGIKDADKLKGVIMAQIDIFGEEKIKKQAEEMAKAMSNAIKGAAV